MITTLYLCENNFGTLMVCYCVALIKKIDSDHMMCNIISFWTLCSKFAFTLQLEVLKDVNIAAAIFFLLLCYLTPQQLLRRYCCCCNVLLVVLLIAMTLNDKLLKLCYVVEDTEDLKIDD